MDPMEAVNLWPILCDLMRRNKESVEELGKKGRELAHAEDDYRRALAIAMAEHRASGQKVTGMMDLCRGRDDVAQLRLKRDLLQSEYDAIQESINVTKRHEDIIDHQMGREWSVGGTNVT